MPPLTMKILWQEGLKGGFPMEKKPGAESKQNSIIIDNLEIDAKPQSGILPQTCQNVNENY